MKKNLKLIYIVELALFFLILLLCSTLNVMANNYRYYLAITFLFLLIIPCYYIFGFPRDNNYTKNNSIRIVVLYLLFFGIISYLLGIILGFTRGYSISVNTLLNGIIPIVLLTIVIETLRFIVLNKAFYDKTSILFFTLLTFIIYVVLNYTEINSSYDLFILFSTIIIPFFAYETLCSYLSVNNGLLPCIIFKLVIFLYPFIIPIVPNYGDYLKSVLDILLCFSIFITINKDLLEFNKIKLKISSFKYKVITIPIFIVLIILILLTSGIFKYQLIAIATNSMNPSFYRGDALIIEKCNINDIKMGDILVFVSDGRIVTHRVVKKYIDDDGIKFITKGDNNNVKDDIISDESNYIGKGIYVFKYIGYPTVLLNEMFMEG